MPTDLYKIQIENFYRDIGEGDVEVVLGSPSTLKKPTGGASYTPARWSLKHVADCFWRSGLILRRVIKLLNSPELNRIIPSLIQEEPVTLTDGIGALASNVKYDDISDIAVVDYIDASGTHSYVNCHRVPENVNYELKSTGLRRSPTAESPVFQITEDKKVTVYPIYGATNPRIATITLTFLPAIETFLPTDTGKDKWNVALSDLLIDGAVMIAKGQTGDNAVKRYMLQELSNKYAFLKEKNRLEQ